MAGREAIRPAREGEGEAVFGVLAAAFEPQEGTRRWERLREIAFRWLPRYVVAEREGRIVATALLVPQTVRIGAARIQKVDVTEVAVLPALQGQGIGTRLLRVCLGQYARKGNHLARLAGLYRFYSRFGFVPFPRRAIEFVLDDVRLGPALVSRAGFLDVPEEEGRRVRPFTARDWHARAPLREAFNRNRTGSLVEGRPGGALPPPPALARVYERDGRVQAYLLAEEYPQDPSPFGARLTIHDAAFEPAAPAALETLLRVFLREALEKGERRVTARLPFDPLLCALLSAAGLPYALREWQDSPVGNMLCLLNLPGLLKAIAPELVARRESAPACAPFHLELRVGEQTAHLRVEETQVWAEESGAPEARVECPPETFLRWLLGLYSFREWQVGACHTLSREQEGVMAALFPREPCASVSWG